MASLRTTLHTGALRRAGTLGTAGLSARFRSNLAPVEPPEAPALHQNQPNYSLQPDKATSTFSPVPKRIQSGTEQSETIPAAIVSGAPIELQGRQVRIYKEAKPATQSGGWKGHHWRMDWDILPKGHRWENPLMGWQSSGDMMQGTRIFFESREDAIRFAEKQGYEYYVQEPNTRAFKPKSYANNFTYSAGKLKMARTK